MRKTQTRWGGTIRFAWTKKIKGQRKKVALQTKEKLALDVA